MDTINQRALPFSFRLNRLFRDQTYFVPGPTAAYGGRLLVGSSLYPYLRNRALKPLFFLEKGVRFLYRILLYFLPPRTPVPPCAHWCFFLSSVIFSSVFSILPFSSLSFFAIYPWLFHFENLLLLALLDGYRSCTIPPKGPLARDGEHSSCICDGGSLRQRASQFDYEQMLSRF